MNYKIGFLEGKTALVTGGGGGIGWGICREFAQEGARVIVTDINEPLGLEVLAEIKNIADLGHEFYGLDVTDIEAGRKLIEEIYSRGNKIDILVNNAGINTPHGILEVTPEDWDKVFNVNFRGHVFLSQAVARKMIENQIKGVILFTTSVHQDIYLGRPHYSTSKAALKRLVKEMAVELAPFNIRVNGVAPGGIYVDEWVDDPALSNDEPRVLLGGKNGIPRDIGRMMVILASDYWARLVTAEVVTVSGGQYLKPQGY